MEFIAYNANPKRRKTDDCYVRALSLALDKNYADVLKDLCNISIEISYSVNSKECIKEYLSRMGIKMEKMPRRKDNTRYTTKEFADELAKPRKIYVLSLAKHLTCIKNKNLYDTWNCGNKSVGNYWIIQK